jgi:hypothetical protein
MREMSSDEALFHVGIMPRWIMREFGHLIFPNPIVLPPWLGGPPLPKPLEPTVAAPDEVEEWRPLRDGTYDVSSLGNVRRAKPGIATFVGRPLRPYAGATGYAMVRVKRDCGEYLHRIVAEVFLGPCPPAHVVNHKDSNKQNNRVSNLEYATYAENSAHWFAAKGRPKGPTKPVAPPKGKPTGDKHWSRRMPERVARGDRMPHTKMTHEKVAEARRRVSAGDMQKTVAADMGVSVATMSRIIRGLRWTQSGPK